MVWETEKLATPVVALRFRGLAVVGQSGNPSTRRVSKSARKWRRNPLKSHETGPEMARRAAQGRPRRMTLTQIASGAMSIAPHGHSAAQRPQPLQ